MENVKDIIPWEEFQQLDSETQRQKLIEWRDRYSNKAIIEEMSVETWKFYDMLKKLDVPKVIASPSRRKERSVEKASEDVSTLQVHLLFDGSVTSQTFQKVFSVLQTILTEAQRVDSVQFAVERFGREFS